jgi:excisionase family DNA binding protein
MPKSHGRDWAGAPEAAAYLGIMQRTLYRMIDRGQLPAYKVGRVIRLRWADIETFIESCRIRPGELYHLYPHDVPDHLRRRRRRRPRQEE